MSISAYSQALSVLSPRVLFWQLLYGHFSTSAAPRRREEARRKQEHEKENKKEEEEDQEEQKTKRERKRKRQRNLNRQEQFWYIFQQVVTSLYH